jgi:hypothetical protein
MLSAVGSQIVDIISNPSPGGVLLVAAGIVVWVAFVLGAQALVMRQRGGKP